MVGLIKFSVLIFGLVLVHSCSNLSHNNPDKERSDRRKEESLKMFKETHRVRKKLSNRRSKIKPHKGKKYYS